MTVMHLASLYLDDRIATDASEGTILGCCLQVVTRLAQRLPVASVPEQGLVAAMRHDVVDYRRRDYLTGLAMLATQRLLTKELDPSQLPLVAVPTLCRGLAPGLDLASDLALVLFAAGATIAHQYAAAWMAAWLRWCGGHGV